MRRLKSNLLGCILEYYFPVGLRLKIEHDHVLLVEFKNQYIRENVGIHEQPPRGVCRSNGTGGATSTQLERKVRLPLGVHNERLLQSEEELQYDESRR